MVGATDNRGGLLERQAACHFWRDAWGGPNADDEYECIFGVTVDLLHHLLTGNYATGTSACLPFVVGLTVLRVPPYGFTGRRCRLKKCARLARLCSRFGAGVSLYHVIPERRQQIVRHVAPGGEHDGVPRFFSLVIVTEKVFFPSCNDL